MTLQRLRAASVILRHLGVWRIVVYVRQVDPGTRYTVLFENQHGHIVDRSSLGGHIIVGAVADASIAVAQRETVNRTENCAVVIDMSACSVAVHDSYEITGVTTPDGIAEPGGITREDVERAMEFERRRHNDYELVSPLLPDGTIPVGNWHMNIAPSDPTHVHVYLDHICMRADNQLEVRLDRQALTTAAAWARLRVDKAKHTFTSTTLVQVEEPPVPYDGREHNPSGMYRFSITCTHPVERVILAINEADFATFADSAYLKYTCETGYVTGRLRMIVCDFDRWQQYESAPAQLQQRRRQRPLRNIVRKPEET